MNEYGIIKLGTEYVTDGTYDAIVEILKDSGLDICRTVSYTQKLNYSTANKASREYKYLVSLVKGKNAQKVLMLIKTKFNNTGLNSNRQIYVSSEEFLGFDLRKYFGASSFTSKRKTMEGYQLTKKRIS